jgi:hypothetical protein
MPRSALRATFALSIAFSGLGAQDFRAQEIVVDSATARARRAWAARNAFDDSVSKSLSLFDTVAAGSIRVVVEPRLKGLTEIAVRLAAAEVAAASGSLVERVANHLFLVRTDPAAHDSISVTTLPSKRLVLTTRRTVAADTTLVALEIARIAQRVIATTADRDLANWVSAAVLPETTTTAEWLRFRIGLASSRSEVARDCHDGKISSCWRALSLVPDNSESPPKASLTCRPFQLPRVCRSEKMGRREVSQMHACAFCIVLLTDVSLSPMKEIPTGSTVACQNKRTAATLARTLRAFLCYASSAFPTHSTRSSIKASSALRCNLAVRVLTND